MKGREIHVDEARSFFERLDGQRYGAYRRLYGVRFRCECGVARFTRVQGDPYAPPSVLEVQGELKLDEFLEKYPVAVADYGYRLLYSRLSKLSRKRGTGNSGYLGVPKPRPVMLRRSGFEVLGSRFVARFWFGLPARGRRILGDAAYEMLVESLSAVCRVVRVLAEGGERLRNHAVTYAVQEYIRSVLPRYKLVSFIGDGSILPRRCATCDDPLPGAIPFESPPELRVEIETPWGVYTGMGVPRGFTAIIGHPFHGKTTLLEAIAAGLYNHIPGDGREKVVTIRGVYWVEAEDGRNVYCRDITPLIHSLPGGKDTRCFTTSDASGATSMAASIVEALEAGAELLLVDEDRAATNLLRVDRRIEELAGPAPVTPLPRYARCLAERGISFIMVTGAIPDIPEEADTVILMKEFRAVTVKRVARSDSFECTLPEQHPVKTRPLHKTRARPPRIEARRERVELNLESNRVLVEEGQYRTIAVLLQRSWSGSLREIARRVDDLISKGFERIVENPGPDLSEIRGLDFIHAIMRLPLGVMSGSRGEAQRQ